MRTVQRLRHLARDAHGVGRRQRPLAQLVGQGAATIPGHCDVQATVARRANVVDRADAAVVQRRRCARFADETVARVVVCRQGTRQTLDCYVPAQPRIVSSVHDAHPATARLRPDLIRSDVSGLRLFDQVRKTRQPRDHTVEHGFTGSLVGGNQRLDLVTHRLVDAARLCEPSRTLLLGQIQRSVEQPAHALHALLGGAQRQVVAGGGHGSEESMSAASSRASQARAKAQSRLTVAAEMSSASAVSSMLMPP